MKESFPVDVATIGNDDFIKYSKLIQQSIHSFESANENNNFVECSKLTKKSTYSSASSTSQIRLVDIIKELSVPIKTEEGCPQIYKLPSIITHENPSKKLRKITIGPQISSLKEEIKILIVGMMGSGKTTFLNGIANYLYGVKWDDNFRFKIVSEEEECKTNNIHTATSQIEYVTAYTLNWQPGFPVPYTVTLIDTPGISDLTVMKIINLLESFFRNEGGWGIDSINAVALVNQSTHCHFCIPARYLVDSILKLFGRDIIN